MGADQWMHTNSDLKTKRVHTIVGFFSLIPKVNKDYKETKEKVKRGKLYNNIPNTMLKIRTNKKWAAVYEVGHDCGFNHGC